MANYTPNLNLRKPLTTEKYDVVADLNDTKDKIDTHAGAVNAQLAQTPTIINVKKHGAIGDGVTDDTLAIQQALDSITISVLSTIPVIDLQGGTYFIKGIDINKSRIKLTNGRFVTDDTTINRALIRVIDAEYIVLDNIHIVTGSDRTNPNKFGCIGFQNSKYCTVVNSFIKGGRWTGGVHDVDSYPISVIDSDSIIFNNVFASNGIFCEVVMVEDSQNCKFISCVIEDGDYSAMALVGKDVVDGNHVISNCTMKNFGTSIVTVDCHGCILSDNILDTSTSEQGINVAHVGTSKGNKTILKGNRINNVGKYGIAIADSRNVLVTGNIITNVGLAGIRTSDGSDAIDILDNLIDGSKQDGVIISCGNFDASHIIKRNTIKNVDRHIISIFGGTRYDIQDNTGINANNKVGGWSGGGNIINFVASTIVPPKRFISKNNNYWNDSFLIGLGASRGVSISNSVASLNLTVKDNDFTDVLYEKVMIAGVSPTHRNIKSNKLSNDPMIGSFTLTAGETTKTITNGNQTGFIPPRLHFRDGAFVGRYIRVSSYTNGSFVITCTTGSVDSVIEYEIV